MQKMKRSKGTVNKMKRLIKDQKENNEEEKMDHACGSCAWNEKNENLSHWFDSDPYFTDDELTLKI